MNLVNECTLCVHGAASGFVIPGSGWYPSIMRNILTQSSGLKLIGLKIIV